MLYLFLFSNKSNKLSDDHSIFDNIRDYFNTYMDFLFNLTLEQQIVLFNLVGLLLLISYLSSTVIILYTNYLISKFNLEWYHIDSWRIVLSKGFWIWIWINKYPVRKSI